MNPGQHSGSVSALRTADSQSGNPHFRRIAIGALLAIGVAAGLYVVIASHSRGRGVAAVVAVISLIGAAITWLAATSPELTSSGRDPHDFHLRP